MMEIGEFVLRLWLAAFATTLMGLAALCLIERQVFVAIVCTVLAALFFTVLSYR